MKTIAGFILFFFLTIILLAGSPEHPSKDAFLRTEGTQLQAYDCVSHHAKSLSVNVVLKSEKEYQEKMKKLRICESQIRKKPSSFSLTEAL